MLIRYFLNIFPGIHWKIIGFLLFLIQKIIGFQINWNWTHQFVGLLICVSQFNLIKEAILKIGQC